MKRVKVVIDDKAPMLQPLFNDILNNFNGAGKILFKKRNEIKIFEFDNKQYAVKSYKVPNLINRIAYGFIRSSKAERSYKYGMKILNLGVETPTPIGYIEVFFWGLLYQSYYVCEYISNAITLSDAVKLSEVEKNEILKAFVDFTYLKLHRNGIYHKDYSGGNILIKKRGEGVYSFAVIDLNRISFKRKISPRKGLENVRRLSVFSIDDILFVGKRYAQLTGEKWPKRTLVRILYYSLRFEWFCFFKNKIKSKIKCF